MMVGTSKHVDDGRDRGSDIDHEADMNYVRSRMKTWVQKYIIDHEICPFAKKSDYRFAIWPGKNIHEPVNGVLVQRFIKAEMDKLSGETENKNRPNTFIVFPFVKDFLKDIDEFNKFCVSHYNFDSISDIGSKLDFVNSGSKVHSFPFHMDMHCVFKSPWPAVHLIMRDDLKRARKGGDDAFNEVADVIREKNNTTLKSEDTQRILARVVLETSKFPEPIHLTKSICPKQREKLHEEGYRVVEAKLESTSPKVSYEGFPANMVELGLKMTFEEFGEVENLVCNVSDDGITLEGEVTFGSVDIAKAAIEQYDGMDMGLGDTLKKENAQEAKG